MQLNNPALLRQQCYINGQWRNANSGGTIDVTNPANGEVIASIPKMGAEETNAAIEAARIAQITWRSMLAKERAAVLMRWFKLMMENQDDLARIMTLEQGKPLAEAKGEIAYAASFLEWFAEEAKRARMVKPFLSIRVTRELSSSNNRLAFAWRLRHGTFLRQ